MGENVVLFLSRVRVEIDTRSPGGRQANWRRVFGEPLRLGVSGRAAVVGVLAPVVGVAFTTWSHDAGFVPWDQFPTYEVAATYLTIVPQTWQTLTLALENAALQLQAKLRSVCRALAPPAGIHWSRDRRAFGLGPPTNQRLGLPPRMCAP